MEQTLTAVIAQAKTSMQEQRALSISCGQKVASLRESYPSFESFAEANNPDTQIERAADERKSIMGDYSTLEMLDIAYGPEAASSWLVAAIANLNSFAGSKSMDD